jgi:hypothetical protein
MYKNLRLNFYFYKSYRKANVIALDLIKHSFHTIDKWADRITEEKSA